jgi:tRNA threonylcarbamoyladenosine modification (KEOPS) complex  Pcc1 subunit
MNDLLTAQLTVPFSCEKHARIVYESLRVDQEPRKHLITRHIALDSTHLHFTWRAAESRILRVSLNSTLEHLDSILQTIQLFELD